jgi:hypothetical protein
MLSNAPGAPFGHAQNAVTAFLLLFPEHRLGYARGRYKNAYGPAVFRRVT